MFKTFHLGVCYYPEHWPAKIIGSDFSRMKAAGFDLVRMGEGAWGYWEPHEGEFQFELFDRAIEFCRKNGLKVILSTPTYCAPAWVVTKYPEVLRWDFNRRPMKHGSRRNLNYTSPKYLELSDRLCTALAEHYRDEKQIIGWQLDNEFNCHMDVSYAPSDTLAFRLWLREKYKTLKRVNSAWGTEFWSQQYSDWEQIDLPHPTAAPPNPTTLLDESRFISDCVIRFARRQAAILRKFNSNWQITHNGLFSNVNGRDLAKELDFFSHDQYPLFSQNWPQIADGLVQARSLSFPFGIMEQQSGPGGQMSYLHRTPLPGELRLWAWQSVAHGAKFVSFFRWRTCPYGAEQHWHGVLDYDSKDTRRLAEATDAGKEFRKLPPEFFEAPPAKFAAVLRDFDNEINERRINTYTKSGANEHSRWLATLARKHVAVNYIWPGDSWNDYEILIVPHHKIASKELAENMLNFAKSGGTLILAAQSGTKDLDCKMVARNPLQSMAGVRVSDWTTLADDERRVACLSDGLPIHFGTFVERLECVGNTKTLANWQSNDPLLGGGGAAITQRFLGKGQVIYIGGYCSDEAIAIILEKLLEVRSEIKAGPDVESIVRSEHKQWILLLNHGQARQIVTGLPVGREIISGRTVNGEWELAAFGVAVVEYK